MLAWPPYPPGGGLILEEVSLPCRDAVRCIEDDAYRPAPEDVGRVRGHGAGRECLGGSLASICDVKGRGSGTAYMSGSISATLDMMGTWGPLREASDSMLLMSLATFASSAVISSPVGVLKRSLEACAHASLPEHSLVKRATMEGYAAFHPSKKRGLYQADPSKA